MLHRPAPPPPPIHSNYAEPLILMSGYLTKRTKTMNRWKKRWWQLLGDGSLLYFKGAARVRVLGEIDIAHTCYDIRLGSQHCYVRFPRFVDPSTCFSFAVLKRTYYVYAPTVHEARQWTDALTNASYVLNRDRPRSLSCSPALQVARAVKPSIPLQPNLSQKENREPLMHLQRDRRPEQRESSSHNLWIDGSPQVRHDFSGHLCDMSNSRPMLRHRAMSQSNLISPAHNYKYSPSLPSSRHMSLSQTALSHPSWGICEEELDQIPEREEDWDGSVSTLPSKGKLRRHQLLSIHSAGWDASCEKLELLQQKEDAIKERLEQLQQQSELMHPHRKKLTRLSPHLEDTEASLSQPTYSTPDETHLHNSGFKQPTFPAINSEISRSLQLLTSSSSPVDRRVSNKRKLKQRQKTPAYVKSGILPEVHRVEVEDISNEETVVGHDFPSLPPPPSPRPSPFLSSTYGMVQPVKGRMMQTQHMTKHESGDEDENNDEENDSELCQTGECWEEKSSAATRYYIAPEGEVKKLVQEIMRVGSVCENGKITVEYAKLQENTEGMFKSLLGTLISAKKQKVVDFEGAVLLKGVNDSTVITLLAQI